VCERVGGSNTQNVASGISARASGLMSAVVILKYKSLKAKAIH
jgi:hypothetical protein